VKKQQGHLRSKPLPVAAVEATHPGTDAAVIVATAATATANLPAVKPYAPAAARAAGEEAGTRSTGEAFTSWKLSGWTGSVGATGSD